VSHPLSIKMLSCELGTFPCHRALVSTTTGQAS
jgi:hypothetical protein